MSPYFGIVVSLAAFGIGTYLFKNERLFPLHPAVCRDGAWNPFLKLGGFSYEDYKSGGDIIKFFLEPATIALPSLYTNSVTS